jgi:hypothetical protein
MEIIAKKINFKQKNYLYIILQGPHYIIIFI